MKISNMVVGLMIPKKHINLNDIAEKFPAPCKYCPEKFPGASIKFTSPKATILAFKSGSIICNGVTNIEDAKITFEKFIDKCGIPADSIEEPIVLNSVASGSMPHKIDLKMVYDKYKTQTFYEIELFPALYFKMKNII